MAWPTCDALFGIGVMAAICQGCWSLGATRLKFSARSAARSKSSQALVWSCGQGASPQCSRPGRGTRLPHDAPKAPRQRHRGLVFEGDFLQCSQSGRGSWSPRDAPKALRQRHTGNAKGRLWDCGSPLPDRSGVWLHCNQE
mmetsp:Transcript_33718/g.60541  ORF Transcript_33718/g.60541 Transcript_33718/m.60541 type:complete len:141 (+) Transcript_33718:44-466(+)